MEITSAVLDQVYRNFRADFASGLDFKPGVDLSFLSSEMPSGGRSNFYPWLDANFRGWREWIGAREFKKALAKAYEIVNRRWENSVEVPIDVIEDDNESSIKMYSELVRGMANGNQEMLWRFPILGLVENIACFDGLPIFSASHKYGDNAIVNITENAFTKDLFEAAFAAAAAWKFADGIACRTSFSHVLFGPSMRGTVWDVVGAQRLSNGADNRNYNRVKMVECNELSGDYASNVYLVDGTGRLKLCVRQIRRAAQIIMDTDPARVLKAGQVDVMGYSRSAYGVTFPHLGYAFVPAAGGAPEAKAPAKAKGKGE